MSQWGMERWFLTDDGGEVRVMPNVDGGTAFDRIQHHHKINDLVMTNCSHTLTSGKAKVEELKKEWVGKSYYDWVNAPPDRRDGMARQWAGTTLPDGVTRERELELMRMIADLARMTSDLVADNYKLRARIGGEQQVNLWKWALIIVALDLGATLLLWGMAVTIMPSACITLLTVMR